MVFMTSDTELGARASSLIGTEEYIKIRDKYHINNLKRFVPLNTHRQIIESSITIAKSVVDGGGTDEEIKRACIFMRICFDARKHRLDFHRARKDLKIEELEQKYVK